MQVKPNINQSNLDNSGNESEFEHYSVFKAKMDFDDLLARIKHAELVVSLTNVFMACVFGLANLIVTIVFLSLGKNPTVEMTLQMLNGDFDELSQEIKDHVTTGIVVVNIVSALKPIGLIVWAFASYPAVTSRKVGSIITMRSSFMAIISVWIIINIVQVYLAAQFISKVNEFTDQFAYFLEWYLGISLVSLLVTVSALCYYCFTLTTYKNVMIKFHSFLNGYRQTPRSRNLKKYRPPQDAIFEEAS